MADGSDVRVASGSRLTNTLDVVVKVVAVGVPILYALGRAFADGYWRELNLSAASLGYATDDYLYSGFVAVIVAISRLIGIQFYTTLGEAFLVALAAAIVVAGLAWLDRWAIRNVKERLSVFGARLKAIKQPAEVARALRVGAAIWAALTLLASTTVLVVVLLLLPLVFASNAGKAQAARDRINLLGHVVSARAAPKTFASYEHAGHTYLSPLLECVENWCVVLEEGAAVAVPKNQVFRIGPSPKTDVAPRAPQPASLNH